MTINTDVLMQIIMSIVIFVIVFHFFVQYLLPINKTKNKKIKVLSKYKASGIIFGKYGSKLVCSLEEEEGHIFVSGGSGLGKTSALLIPTLRTWKGTAFVIDIAGDIYKNTRRANSLVFKPQQSKTTLPYNIFAAIDRKTNIEIKDEMLEQLAFLLMPDKINMSEAADFFNREGRKILTAALICYYHKGLDFVPICENIMENNWRDLLNDIAGHNNSKANKYIASFAGASEQNNAGCKQSVDTTIKLFATNEKIKRCLRRAKENELYIAPEDLERKSIFIVIDDDKLKLYAPLVHIITSQLLEYFSKRSKKNTSKILFCIDEFASFGKIEITDALRKLRKKYVRIMILTQSLADVDLIYGRDERMAMMNNYPYKVILGCDDVDTQEYFSKLIGEKESKRFSTSKNMRQTTHTESEQKEKIIEPAELARLMDNLILLSPDGYRKLKKNFYYKKNIAEKICEYLKRRS